MDQLKHHSLLPIPAQDILREAYKKAVKEDEETLARALIVDKAVRRVRREYPQYFKDCRTS